MVVGWHGPQRLPREPPFSPESSGQGFWGSCFLLPPGQVVILQENHKQSFNTG